jgi:hypothetical protein
MSGPRLSAEVLIWRNRRARSQFNQAIIALLVSLGLTAVLIAERESLARCVQWLFSHRQGCAGLAVFFGAVGVAQRRALQRTRFPRSWLAAVPVRTATARWEAFLIDTLPAVVAVLGLCGFALLVSLALAFQPTLSLKTIFALWAYLSGGIACGVALSFLIPVPKPVDLPPGSRYVPKPRVDRAAAIRPSLRGLGWWPIRQMFAWAQPKVVARALVPVLVMMPLGTRADDAMIAMGLFAVLLAMALLSGAVISVSRDAQRWLSPAPVRRVALIRALLLPAWGVIAAASVIGALLLLVFDVSYRLSAAVAAIAAVTDCAAIAIALLWNLRPRRGL